MLESLKKIRPVILCGGSGTRLWPLSRESHPKQFLKLLGQETLLESTLARVKSFNEPILVASKEHRFLIQETVNRHNIKSRILLEPAAKNTTAAVALSCLISNPDEVVVFLPSDHYIQDIELFQKTISRSIEIANKGYIVTLGVKPNYPATGYGYIEPSDEKIDEHSSLICKFIEKPDLCTAQELFESNKYLWNSGVLIGRVDTIINALEFHANDIIDVCKKSIISAAVEGDLIHPDPNIFSTCRSESIDYAVLEKHKKVAVLELHASWSDVGNWASVSELADHDAAGNTVIGKGFVLDSKSTYINAKERNVVAIGVSNICIIDTKDALLVVDKEKVNEVKHAVAKIKITSPEIAIQHNQVKRPWGSYDSIDSGSRFQVKHITVHPKEMLSLQLHHHRSEHWIVVSGTALVTVGSDEFLLTENQSTYIPVGVKHRLTNPGLTNLELIEVQTGSYLGEDDIIRFSDNYGRMNETSSGNNLKIENLKSAGR